MIDKRSLICWMLVVTGFAFAQTGQLNISWDANPESDIDFYRLQRAVNSTSAFSDFQDVNSPQTSTVDTDVSRGNLYAYRVAAFNTDGLSSAYSTLVSVGIPEITMALGSLTTGQATTVALASNVDDPDHSAGDFSYQVSGQSNLTAVVQGGNLIITPSPIAYTGPASFVLRVTDPDQLFDEQTIAVTFIQGTVISMSVDIPDLSFDEDGSFDMFMDSCVTTEGFSPSEVDWSFSFTQNYDYTYQSNTRILDITTASPDWSGSSYAIATATAPDNSTAVDTFGVTVNAINDAPVSTISMLEISGDPVNNIFDLNQYATDVEDEPEDLIWSFWGFSDFEIDWYDAPNNIIQVTHLGGDITDQGYFRVEDPDGGSDVAQVSLELLEDDVTPMFIVNVPAINLTGTGAYTVQMDTCVFINTYSPDELTWTFRQRRYMDNTYNEATRTLTIAFRGSRRAQNTEMIATATAPDQSTRSDTFAINLVEGLLNNGQQAYLAAGEEAAEMTETISVDEDASVEFQLSSIVGDAVAFEKYAWHYESGEGVAVEVDESSGLVLIHPVKDWSGEVIVRLTGTDEAGQMVIANLEVEVEARNDLHHFEISGNDRRTALVMDLETEFPSLLELQYWTADADRKTIYQDEFRTGHLVTLEGLMPDTTYRFTLTATDNQGGVITLADSTFSSDGIYAYLDADEFVVYPNPLRTSDGHREMIFLNMPEQARNLSLYSVVGDRIYDQPVEEMLRNEFRLNVTGDQLNLTSGLYIYVVKDDKSRVLKRGKFAVIN